MHRPNRKFEAARHHHAPHAPHAHHGHHHHHHAHDHGPQSAAIQLAAVIVPIVLVGLVILANVLGLYTTIFGVDTALLITFIAGFNIFYQAMTKLLQFKLSVDLALVVAVAAAVALGEYVAAAEVVFIMMVGEGLEDYAATRTHAAIAKLMELAPSTALIRRAGDEVEVPISEVMVDDVVIVKPGERLPVDGTIEAGSGVINQSVLTGESMPVERIAGDEVYAGTMNEGSRVEVRATGLGSESKLGQIIDLIEEAQAAKAPVERAADRYARWFLPMVIIAAVATYVFTADWMRVAGVLIIACPCALVLATPTAVLAGIARMAREGILVKGGLYLESVARSKAVFFDKTGTVTTGDARISRVVTFGGVDERVVLGLAASAESHASHLFARLILDEAHKRGIQLSTPDDVVVAPGLGLQATVGGQEIFIGNERLMKHHQIALGEEAAEQLNAVYGRGESAVLIAEKTRMGPALLGLITITDSARPEAKQAVADLRAMGFEQMTLVTGDNDRAGETAARKIGLSDCRAELFPDDKVGVIQQAQQDGRISMMIGDGVNDAPALAIADVGIAMGGIGSDISIEAADIVIMSDDLSKIPRLVLFSRRVLKTIRANIIIFALVVNAVGIYAAAAGFLSPIQAAIAHQISSFLVVCNSLRLLGFERFAGFGPMRAFSAAGRWASDSWESIEHYDWDWAIGAIVRRRRTWLRAIAFLAPALYVLSGFYIVGPEERAVAQRFGTIVEAAVEPGLHYRLPWPIGKARVFAPNRVRSVQVGLDLSGSYRSAEAASPEGAVEWNARHADGIYGGEPKGTLILTGDTQLIVPSLAVQYTVSDLRRHLFEIRDAERLIQAVAEAALGEVAATEPIERLLTSGRTQLENKIAALMQTRLDAYGAGTEIFGARFVEVHPPIEVIAAFREVASARESKDRRVNEAHAYRNRTLALVRGRAAAALNGARSFSQDRELRALGDAGRLRQITEAYQNAPEITKHRMYFEAMENMPARMKKYIVESNETDQPNLVVWPDLGRLGPIAAPQMFNGFGPAGFEPEEANP